MINVAASGVIKFVNLCPHEINLIGSGGTVITFAESGQVARVDTKRATAQVKMQIAPNVFMDMCVQDVEQTEVIGLPDPEENVIYLVSSYVAQYFRGKRTDLLCPSADSTATRDSEGKVTGVRSFINYV